MIFIGLVLGIILGVTAIINLINADMLAALSIVALFIFAVNAWARTGMKTCFSLTVNLFIGLLAGVFLADFTARYAIKIIVYCVYSGLYLIFRA